MNSMNCLKIKIFPRRMLLEFPSGRLALRCVAFVKTTFLKVKDNEVGENQHDDDDDDVYLSLFSFGIILNTFDVTGKKGATASFIFI